MCFILYFLAAAAVSSTVARTVKMHFTEYFVQGLILWIISIFFLSKDKWKRWNKVSSLSLISSFLYQEKVCLYVSSSLVKKSWFNLRCYCLVVFLRPNKYNIPFFSTKKSTSSNINRVKGKSLIISVEKLRPRN